MHLLSTGGAFSAHTDFSHHEFLNVSLSFHTDKTPCMVSLQRQTEPPRAVPWLSTRQVPCQSADRRFQRRVLIT